jgi:hypothetical protein
MKGAEPAKSSLNPQALTLADAVRVFSAATGAVIDVAMLESDIEAGAPANADGTLNVVHYAAWLVQEMGHGS